MRTMLKRLRARRQDDEGLTLSEPIIVILLLVLFGTAAVVAILFFRGRGETTVARNNIEQAQIAAESLHNFSSTGQFPANIEARLTQVVPEVTFTALGAGNHNDADRAAATGHCLVGPSGGPPATTSTLAPTAGTCSSGVLTGAVTGGFPGPDELFVRVLGDLTWRGESVASGDALLLQIRAANGDTYCTVVIPESRGGGNAIGIDAVGTWHDAHLSGGDIANCGSVAGAAVTLPTNLRRGSFPDLS